VTVEGQIGEIQMMEPPLASTMRALLESKKNATLYSLDGSGVKGQIIDVSEDGTTVTLRNVDDYVFDVAAVVMVKIERAPSEG
jgi:hypothetical protein